MSGLIKIVLFDFGSDIIVVCRKYEESQNKTWRHSLELEYAFGDMLS